MSVLLAAGRELQPAVSLQLMTKDSKPSATGGYLLHLREATNNSFPQPGLNIRGPVLTTYMKRQSSELFSERLNWATNLQNPVIREMFPGLSVNRGRGN